MHARSAHRIASAMAPSVLAGTPCSTVWCEPTSTLRGLGGDQQHGLADPSTRSIAFADDAHHALIQIHLIVLEADHSETRSPRVEHFQHGAIAVPQWIGTVGASSSESTSPRSATWAGSGRFGIRDLRGLGLAKSIPRASMKRKNRRKLDNCRAVDRGRDPPSTRAAMKPNNSMRVALTTRYPLLEPSGQGRQVGAVRRERIGERPRSNPHGIEKALQGGICRLANSSTAAPEVRV